MTIRSADVSFANDIRFDKVARDGHSYWALHYTSADASYELRVRFDAVETQYTFGVWCDGDFTELLTPGQMTRRIDDMLANEPERFASRLDAREWLEAHGISKSYGPGEPVRAEMVRRWEAFALLFNPVYAL